MLAVSLALAACGDLESDGTSADSRGELTENTTTSADGASGTPSKPAVALPARPANVVQIAGQTVGSITDEVVSQFSGFANRRGLAVRVEAADTDELAGFGALCEGRVDVAASSRLITDSELQACANNGLEVIDFQVAFDAIVIVTRNERDVGADCVNLAQVRSIFQNGSPIQSWNQINPNFAPLALRTTGPDQSSSQFDFFGARVLGVPNPTLANFRADYRAFPREGRIKDFIKNRPPGAVGIIGFSYYELFEQFLRPLEIDGQTGDRCVFPSAETISSELYPLERTLRLYTTDRSLKRQEVKTYLRYHLSQAEDIANRSELIPLPDQLRDQQLAQIENPDAAAAITPSGATTGDTPTTSTTGATTTTTGTDSTSPTSTTTTTTDSGAAGG